jgi:hypothetical protein
MKLTGPHIVSQLRDKLTFAVGRHLYAALGSYQQLARFEQNDLTQARDHQGQPLPAPINVNRALLDHLGDEELRHLVQTEARRFNAAQRHLNHAFDRLLQTLLQERRFLILKQVELLFAYSLDLSVLRIRASNQNHILLLLPAELHGEQLIVFHQAAQRFHRTIPGNLIAENHLWELTDG